MIYLRRLLRERGPAEFEKSFFNDTFNILNQKSSFLRHNEVILAFALSQLIDRKRCFTNFKN